MSSAPIKLLLVEDEPTQLLVMQRVLGQAGYAVETAGDGEEALEKISNGQFQMLVTDWDMPGMDGVTLCRRIREAQSQLPGYLYILLLTSHSSTENVVTGLEAGADDYISKPPKTPELLARLKAGQRVLQLEQSLREARDKIHQLSITDPLVGTYNRRYLNDHLVQEVERARRYGHSLAAVMADLDFFKNVNDQHGHQAGDDVLRGFVELAKASIRSSDWVARYGGEEFVVVLPETDLAGAAATAEKIRGCCATAPFETTAGRLVVTASFGVAALDAGSVPVGTAAEALLRRVDSALYRSKHEGRNRVTIADPPDTGTAG